MAFTPVILACADYSKPYINALLDGAVVEFFTCEGYALLGPTIFSLLIFAPIALGFYVYSEGVALPLTISIILGAIIVPTLPGRALQVLITVLLLGGGLAMTIFVRRGMNAN